MDRVEGEVKLTSVLHTNRVEKQSIMSNSERELGLWVRVYLVLPMLVSFLFLAIAAVYYSTSNLGHKAWGAFLIPSIVSFVLGLLARHCVGNFNRWGVVFLIIDFIYCPIAVINANHVYEITNPAYLEFQFTILIIGFVLTWLVFRPKWKYFKWMSL